MREKITSPDRVVILLSLVPYLLKHGETTLRDLSSAFGVSESVMRELVEFLGTAGAPGETHTYQDEDLFDIDWAALEEDGIVRLIRAVVIDDVPRFSELERAALIAGLQAVTPLLPESLQETARSAGSKLARFEVAAGDSRATSVFSASDVVTDRRLADLVSFIKASAILAFTYRDLRGVQSSRKVHPKSLIQSGTGWYLRAYCFDREAERTFAIDRISDLVTVGETAVGDAHHEGANTRLTDAPSIAPEEANIWAQVRLRENALHRVRSFSPTISGTPSDGWVRAKVKLSHPGAAVKLVQAAPGEIIVESPVSARHAVAAWAERALAQYDA